MRERQFEFEVYRLNVIDELDLWTNQLKAIQSDDDIIEVVAKATRAEFDTTTEGRVRRYRWSLRGYRIYDKEGYSDVFSVTLARSVLEQYGQVVTDHDVVPGVSASSPPLAETAEIFFFLKRHIVIVERTPDILISNTWRNAVENIISSASRASGFRSRVAFEPKPKHNEIIDAFRSFDVLTRLRVHLRLPNPELSRYTESLFHDLRNGGIRDYIQDMRNPRGLSKSEDARPFASAVMAQQGYKAKEVTLEGYRDGRFEKVTTGNQAARGRINELREFVRGLKANATTKEGARVLDAISREIERVAPREEGAA